MLTIDDLKKLHSEIWDIIPANPLSYNIYERMNRAHESRTRKVSDEEWAAVAEAVGRLDLIVELHNACMGFGVGMCLSEQPSVLGVEPEFVINITSGHFKSPEGVNGFDFAWERFIPLADTERNKKLLAYFHLDPLREKRHYEY